MQKDALPSGTVSLGSAVPAPSALEWGLAVCLALGIGAWTWSHAGFPLGIHADEWTKVAAVRTGQWPYFHPLWMLDLARLSNAWLRLDDPQAVVELGRHLGTVSLGLLVVATWLLGRLFLPSGLALVVAGVCGLVPVVQVSALSFKEDIFAAPWVVLAMWALIRQLGGSTAGRAASLGLFLGVAASAKYVAGVMVPFAVLGLMLWQPGRVRARAMVAFGVLCTALCVFALIHWPAWHRLETLRNGWLMEWTHANAGHDVVFPLGLTWGMFHLRQSLVPGLGWPMVLLGVAGLAAAGLRRSDVHPGLPLLAGWVGLWYALHEISPLKPFPGFQRYMVPLVPFLLVLGAHALRQLVSWGLPRRRVFGTCILLWGVASFPPFWQTWQIVAHLDHDPRLSVGEAAKAVASSVTLAPYSSLAEPNWSDSRYLNATHGLVVVSSLHYERFFQRGKAGNLRPDVVDAMHRYASLFQRPYLEVTNGGPNFGFFNPVLRVVSLEGDTRTLAQLAHEVRGRDATLSAILKMP